jgi:hypothetical protein
MAVYSRSGGSSTPEFHRTIDRPSPVRFSCHAGAEVFQVVLPQVWDDFQLVGSDPTLTKFDGATVELSREALRRSGRA